MRTPREKLHEVVSARMAKLRMRSTKYALEQSRRRPVHDPETGKPLVGPDGKPLEASPWELRRWDERNVADVMCNAIMTMHEAGERANKMATRPIALGVIVLPEQSESLEAWEREKAEFEAKANAIPVLALPPKGAQ